jgi:hypothetical protein
MSVKVPVIRKKPIILSLFDESGQWSEPYRKAGYVVVQIDLKLGIDIMTWKYREIPRERVRGILAAPPCTHIAGSGAQYWPAKDRDGRTREAVKLVRKTLEIIRYFNPKFWAIENPVGRMNTIIPEIAAFGPWYFNPYEFGDAYTKKTGLWGKFKMPLKDPVKPKKTTKHGSWVMALGGSSDRTKEIRSITPKGFSEAFF